MLRLNNRRSRSKAPPQRKLVERMITSPYTRSLGSCSPMKAATRARVSASYRLSSAPRKSNHVPVARSTPRFMAS
ncbi:Uncharacterised protein [Mycobacterium tuberculosis]|nr:Uncharacterised protein [Mycobacterium tuberculosis]